MLTSRCHTALGMEIMNTSLRDRWRRLQQAFRSSGDDEWFALVFARPLANIFLLPVADLPLITPNFLSITAFVLGLVGIWAFLQGYDESGVALILIRCVVDSMDGHLARYRGAGSNLGAYIDKATDALFWAGLFGVLGYRAWLVTGNHVHVWLGFIAATSRIFIGYVYWVENYMYLRAHPNHRPRSFSYRWDPTTVTGWFASHVHIWKLSEPDYYFWTSLFVLLDRWDLLMYFVGTTHAVLAVVKLIQRAIRVRALDGRNHVS